MNGFIPVGEYGPGVKKLDRRDDETNLIVQDILENFSNEDIDLMRLQQYSAQA